MNNSNQYIVALALCTLGTITSPEMARDLQDDIERMLKSSSCNPYLKKKAIICAARMIDRAPELIENFISVTRSLLNDKDHGVINAAVILIREMCKHGRDTIDHFRQLVPTLCQLLKTLVLSGFNPEHDVQGITDPFLQVAILRLLRVLGHGSVEASDAMNDVLAQVATSIESTKNVGNSVLYETVRTIMYIEAESGLRVLAINILGRFLLNNDKNIRYVALNTLLKTVEIDNNAVQRHRNTIVDCLKDADVSLRKRALELTFALVNESNVRSLLRELLSFLEVADLEFKTYITTNICMCAERYAPNKRWHIDTVMKVLMKAGNHVNDEVIASLIGLITQTSELHAYIVQSLYVALQEDITQQPMVQIATYCIGEYGDLLVSGRCEEAEPLDVSEREVVNILHSILVSPLTTSLTKGFVLSALMKLTTRFHSGVDEIRRLIDRYRSSINTELQQRAVEYSSLFSMDTMRTALLEPMPPIEKKIYTYHNNFNEEEDDEGDSVRRLSGQQPVKESNDLLDLLGGSPPVSTGMSVPAAAAPSGGVGGGSNDLLDILGGDIFGGGAPVMGAGEPHRNQTSMGGMNGLGGMMDLGVGSERVGGMGSSGPVSGGDALMDLMSSSPPKTGNVGGPPARKASDLPSMTVWDKNDLHIVFDFQKQADNPNVLIISLTATNNGAGELSGFNFQAAVPKSFKLQILPPSGQTLGAFSTVPVTQQIKVANPSQSSLKMRIRIQYTNSGGQAVTEQGELSGFPM